MGFISIVEELELRMAEVRKHRLTSRHVCDIDQGYRIGDIACNEYR
jgi:hypothetical protein